MSEAPGGWTIYERKRARGLFRRRATLLAAAIACLGATFFVGADMAQWKRVRVFNIDDAINMPEEVPIEQRRKAIVAMQREGRRIVERLRLMTTDPDPVVVANAENALASIAATLR